MVAGLISCLAIMKRFLPLFVAAVLAAGSSAYAGDGQSIALIVTKSGKTYEHCRVFKQYPDGVLFAHQNGAAKVLYADMTDASRQALGYDPEKAEAYQKSLAEKRQKEREREFELAKMIAQARIADGQLHAMGLGSGRAQSAEGDVVWNSGTLDYTRILLWNCYGWNRGSYGQRGRGDGYTAARGTFQNGPINSTVSGNFISVPRRFAAPVPAARPPLGVPALSGFAPPMAVQAIPSARR